MNTDKKNQHYIPKFYLRNFSYRNNLKQIGLYNTRKNFFYQTAPLKNQGSKNFFYGRDGVIEDHLSNIEGHLSKSINQIIHDERIPKKDDFEYLQLLHFVGLTHLRSPVLIESMIRARELMKQDVLSLDVNANIDKLIPKITHELAIEVALSGLRDVVENIFDLECKLLINKTNKPFIGSDFPVVKYNRFLESIDWQRGKTGYGNTGLKIFIPLNSKFTILLYDAMIYKVGFKKQPHLDLKDEKSVNQLNILQILNCFETVFFNEECSRNYIEKLVDQSIKYNKANVPESQLSHLINRGEKFDPAKKKNLIILGTSDCETKLDIEGIKIHSGSKKINMKVHENMLRPLPRYLARNSR